MNNENLEQQVLLYKTKDGKVPFRDWLGRVKDSRAIERIQARVARVRLGNFGDAKSVGSGVQELRIQHGKGLRIYFGRSGSTVVILLCGGDKTSQQKDIALAKQYWRDFKETHSAN